MIALLAGLVIAALVFTLVMVTAKFIRNYRKKKNDQVVVSSLKNLVKSAPHVSRDVFDMMEENPDATIVADYDPETDKVNDWDMGNERDREVEAILRRNGGSVIID